MKPRIYCSVDRSWRRASKVSTTDQTFHLENLEKAESSITLYLYNTLHKQCFLDTFTQLKSGIFIPQSSSISLSHSPGLSSNIISYLVMLLLLLILLFPATKDHYYLARWCDLHLTHVRMVSDLGVRPLWFAIDPHFRHSITT